MPDTFVKIASVTVGSGGTAYLEFTSIPQTYTDLCLKLSARSNTSAPSLYLQFNSSGGTAYSSRQLTGTGASAQSQNNSGLAFNLFPSFGTGTDDTSNTFSNIEFYIPNYAGSSNKSFGVDSAKERNGNNYNYANGLGAGLWANTAAVTSIIIDFDGDLVQYSTATLYGIKNS